MTTEYVVHEIIAAILIVVAIVGVVAIVRLAIRGIRGVEHRLATGGIPPDDPERDRMPKATALPEKSGRRLLPRWRELPRIERLHGTDKSGTIGQTPRTRSPDGDPFSMPTGDVGRKAPAVVSKPPAIPPKTYSMLPGGGRRRFRS